MTRSGAARERLGPWDVFVVATVMLGLACATGVWGLRASIAVLVTSTCTAAVIGGVVTERVTAGIRTGVAVGVCLGAAAGLVAGLGSLGVLILLGLAVTSPVVLSRLEGRWRAVPPRGRSFDAGPPEPEPPDEVAAPTPMIEPAPADVRALDDAELCLEWRRSFVRLETVRGAAARLAVVEQRQRYLDELQRRHTDAFQKWLQSGARASGNPLPFLQERPPETPEGMAQDQGPEPPA
jgi:hypothetical protein